MRRKGIQVFIAAPLKGHEFHRACSNIGGEFIQISPASKNCINVMEITHFERGGGLLWAVLSAYSKYQMSKVPELSFQEALEYTTQDNADAVITVGIIKDGRTSYTVYGENGKELPKELHTYEIGSLTKTFTAAMVSKAAQEEKIDINATIDQYLSLPEGNVYPTVAALLTHTSGYKSYYMESPMISNFFTGKNSFWL